MSSNDSVSENSSLKRAGEDVQPDEQFNAPSPPKIEKTEPDSESPADGIEAAEKEEIDLSLLEDDGLEEIDLSLLEEESDDDGEAVKDLAKWSGGTTDARVKVTIVRVKLDKPIEKGPGKPDSCVFNVLVEDKSGLTNLVAFGENALRLKKHVTDKKGHAIELRGVMAKIPEEKNKKFLPGLIPYELLFERNSTVTVVEPTKTLLKLSDLTNAEGMQKTDFRVVACSKFINTSFNPSFPVYRADVTDGIFKTPLEVQCNIDCKIGNEIQLAFVKPIVKDGSTVIMQVLNASDFIVIKKAEEYTIPRQKMQLRKLEKA